MPKKLTVKVVRNADDVKYSRNRKSLVIIKVFTRNRKLHTNKYYYPANSSNVATARRVLGRIY